MIVLGHAADQTEDNTELQEQGQLQRRHYGKSLVLFLNYLNQYLPIRIWCVPDNIFGDFVKKHLLVAFDGLNSIRKFIYDVHMFHRSVLCTLDENQCYSLEHHYRLLQRNAFFFDG